jgi:hypothetical protein
MTRAHFSLLLPLITLLASFAASGCVLPFAVPPLTTDLGGARIIQGGTGNVFHLSTGLHSASFEAIPRSDVLDIGVGYALDADGTGLRDQGVYGEGAWFVMRRPHARIAPGGRGELLFSKGRTGGGLFARVSAEIFTSVDGDGQSNDPCGTAFYHWAGIPSTGLYAEAGVQYLPEGRTSFVTTGGLTFRLPAIAGFALLLPGCH